MTRLSRTAVVTTAFVVEAVGGCAWTDARASASLRAELPDMMSPAGFDTMPDWRLIGYPPDTIRSFLSYDGTYRVIESDVDDATLAVWRTGPQGPGPVFNESEVATGSACVQLHRETGAVSVTVVDCPPPLPEAAPWADDYSWGRDAVAVTSASSAVDAATEEVRRMLIRGTDGRPRDTERTAADIVRVTEADRPQFGSTVVASAVDQTGHIVTLSLTATATAPEAADATGTISARWCARLRVDLDDPYPNVIGEDGPCA